MAMTLALPWNLDPVALTLGPVQIRWYGILFTAGLLLAIRLGTPLARTVGVTPEQDDSLVAWVVAGVVVGARLGHVLFYEPGKYLADPLSVLAVWHGGLASHGGVIGGLLGLLFFARKRGIPELPLLDVAAAVAPFTGAAIRLGNFCNSEIIGHPTTLPWAVRFVRVDDLPRHPAQLYEAITYSMIGLLLWQTARRRPARRPGWLLGWSLVLVFTARFALEFLKEPQVAVEARWPLDLGQLLSLPAVAVGLLLLFRASRPNDALPSPQPDSSGDRS